MIRRQWIFRFLLGWSYSHDPASAPSYRMIYDPLELCTPCALGLLLPHGRPECRSIYAVFPAWRQGILRGVGKVSGYCCYEARSRVKAGPALIAGLIAWFLPTTPHNFLQELHIRCIWWSLHTSEYASHAGHQWEG